MSDVLQIISPMTAIKFIQPPILKGEDGEEWKEYSMQLKAACDNGDVSLVTSLKKMRNEKSRQLGKERERYKNFVANLERTRQLEEQILQKRQLQQQQQQQQQQSHRHCGMCLLHHQQRRQSNRIKKKQEYKYQQQKLQERRQRRKIQQKTITIPTETGQQNSKQHPRRKQPQQQKQRISTPILVVNREFLDRKSSEGCQVVLLHPLSTKNKGFDFNYNIENNIKVDVDSEKPIIMVIPEQDITHLGLKYERKYVNNNEGTSEDIYLIVAVVVRMKRNKNCPVFSEEHLVDIYKIHKSNIFNNNTTSHFGSYGIYYANGWKASYNEIGIDLSSLGLYATSKKDRASFCKYEEEKDKVNQHLIQANAALNALLENDCAINMASNARIGDELNKAYNEAPNISRPGWLGKNKKTQLQWLSTNVCINAGTREFHTENDVSMTEISRPFVKEESCNCKCGFHTTFNFEVSQSYTVPIPLRQGTTILFSGYFLRHRQLNQCVEMGVQCDCDNFINFSAYSNRRLGNNFGRTIERISCND